jgi:integrase
MMMRQAREEGLHNNMEIERKAFKPLSEEVDNIYLTEEEVKALHNLDLSKFDLTPSNTKLKPSEINNLPVVRDVFLVGCYLAQRYSDYSRLNNGMIKTIDGKKYVELIQQKTREKVIIPIKPELDEILRRYDYNLPKTFQPKVNKGIKIIARAAGITEMIQDEKSRGGLIVKKEVPKCDLIKTHTARRTGCTLMFLAGLPSITIMKFSGHKTETEFLKYINVSKQETAILLSDHPYFGGTPLKVAK